MTLSPTADPAAWAIIKQYASGVIETFPEVEERLTEYLGSKYQFGNWREVFTAVDNAENDTVTAVTAIKELASKYLTVRQQPPSPTMATTHNPPLCQLNMLEHDLMVQVAELQKRKRIRGTALSLEEMLNPIEENCVGETGYEFPGGDEEIIARVIEVARSNDGADSGSEDDEAETSEVHTEDVTKPSKALDICAQMEKLCLEYSSPDICVVDLQSHVRKLRAHFRRLDDQSQVQTSLDHFWSRLS